MKLFELEIKLDCHYFHATRFHLPYEERKAWGRGEDFISPGVTCSFLHTRGIRYAMPDYLCPPAPCSISLLSIPTKYALLVRLLCPCLTYGVPKVPAIASCGFEREGAEMCALNPSLSRGDSISYLYDSERSMLGEFDRWNV